MKKKFFTLIFVVIGFSAFAQSPSLRKHQTDSVAKLVQKFFNERNAGKIYEMTTPGVQDKFSYGQWKEIFETNFFKEGKIQKLELESYEYGTCSYKATINPKKSYLMTISLDSKKRIQDLNFNTYKKSKNASK